MDFQPALKQFGLSSFRPGQQDVVQAVLSGHDCLCVMPTGGGKSLCYQLPSIVRPGLTIVVSPLIALMKDQVDALSKRGIRACLINSTLSNNEQQQRLDEVSQGKFSLLYVAPERLRNSRFLDVIRATPVQLLAVDEAHCISEWGHDFRPDYARIGRFREALGGVQTIALTATATPRVQKDIGDILRLRHPKCFVTGFARENLYLGSVYCNGDRDKDRALVEFLKNEEGSGIIYAATRKRCESLVEYLTEQLKISIGAYHAGLTPDQRRTVQEQFMSNKLKAIVATNAFGMGIDKSDLRYVIHYNLPGSLEAYYQEAGRAGRDGLPSKCVVLFASQDRNIQEFFIENANPPRELIEKVYSFLCERTEDPIELTALEMRETIDVPQSAEAVSASLQVLSKTSVIERLEASGGLAMVRLTSNLPSVVDMLPKSAENKRKVLRSVERAIGDRRDEAVYVHPRWLMQQTGMERDTLGRYLNELKALDCFEYVPPFRGRAIHFRRRNVPFDSLQIDFKTLDERKKADFEKLDQVVAFAQSRRCRQLAILQYFGDPAAKPCGRCDRCQGHAGWPVMPNPNEANANVVEDVSNENNSKNPTDISEQPKSTTKSSATQKLTVFAGQSQITREHLQKLTEAIAAIDRLHGRLGKLIIADFLSGSDSEKVKRYRMDRLSGFGIFKFAKKKNVVLALDAMLTTGLLEQQEATAKRPTVYVTQAGREFVGGQRTLPEPLESHLLNLLPDLGQQSKGFPPSTQTTSIETPAILPQAVTPLATEPTLRHENQIVAPKSAPAHASFSSDWQWTVALVTKGFTITEIAAIRRKTIDEIISDLTDAANAGTEVSIQKLLDQRSLIALESARTSPSQPTSEHAVFRERPALFKLALAMRASSKLLIAPRELLGQEQM
ncbi:MAG: RecQ family ATP-dependent DNA helicase [Planctomycetota bacterium]|nr:RecQ family ATP-dependent DNA helicase [Planctomycetota bacterium]